MGFIPLLSFPFLGVSMDFNREVEHETPQDCQLPSLLTAEGFYVFLRPLGQSFVDLFEFIKLNLELSELFFVILFLHVSFVVIDYGLMQSVQIVG